MRRDRRRGDAGCECGCGAECFGVNLRVLEAKTRESRTDVVHETRRPAQIYVAGGGEPELGDRRCGQPDVLGVGRERLARYGLSVEDAKVSVAEPVEQRPAF